MNAPAWRVGLSPRAQRDFHRLDPQVPKRVEVALGGWLPGPAFRRAKGYGTDEQRLRVGDWRVRFRRDVAAPTTASQSSFHVGGSRFALQRLVCS